MLFKDYNEKEIKYMIMLYLFALVFISLERYIETLIENKDNWFANTFNAGLIHFKSDHTEKITCKRGKGYFLKNGKQNAEQCDNLKYCVFTMWSFMHFIFYILIGFFCPSLFFLTLSIGIIFEIFEYFTFDCHDILDVVYNSSGFGVGYLLHKLFSHNIV